MDEKYLQGRASLLSVSIDDLMYKLSNGNYIRIYSLADDPEYEYGYDYFDSSKKIIDGGVFNYDAGSEEEVLVEAMGWCDLNPKKIQWELISEEADTGYLEDEGFTGW